MARIGLLGGTFDPPHIAHLIAAERAIDAIALDKVLFIPAAVPPHKSEAKISSVEDRLAMLRLATHDNPKFEISTIELDRPGPSYTIDTLRQLKQQSPSDNFVLLIGTDQFQQFDSWREPDQILSLAEIVVVARSSSQQRRDGFRFFDMPLIDISATEIRQRVRDGRTIRYLVPDAVRTYIAAHHLYQ